MVYKKLCTIAGKFLENAFERLDGEVMPKKIQPSAPAAMPAAFAPWKLTADLVAAVGGPRTEVVLHDLSDPVHSVIYVVNGHVTDREVGQGVRHLVEEMLLRGENPEKGDLFPVWWYRHKGKDGAEKLVRSITMLIRRPDGKLAGALCVNQDVTDEAQALLRLEAFLPPEMRGAATGVPDDAREERTSRSGAEEVALSGRQSVAEAVFDLIDRIVDEDDSGKGPYGAKTTDGKTIRSRDGRLELLAFMDSRGVFLMKGALEHAAMRLGVSKVTIYSDLDAIRRAGSEAAS